VCGDSEANPRYRARQDGRIIQAMGLFLLVTGLVVLIPLAAEYRSGERHGRELVSATLIALGLIGAGLGLWLAGGPIRDRAVEGGIGLTLLGLLLRPSEPFSEAEAEGEAALEAPLPSIAATRQIAEPDPRAGGASRPFSRAASPTRRREAGARRFRSTRSVRPARAMSPRPAL
jgi:hypothetical protein